MTPQQYGTIMLIKSALTEKTQNLPPEFNITEAFETAKRHGITAIIYYGAHTCGIDTKSEEMQKHLPKIYASIMSCAKQEANIKQVLAAFEAHGIKHIPLKGTNLRKFYPKPEMRRMGDADILIDTEQYDKIRPIMLELGYTEGVESDHELHWTLGSTLIELHKRLIPSYNKDYYAYFGDGWKLAKPKDGKKYEYTMSAEDEFIYVFTHFAKHYRDAGIGIRHFTDLWLLKTNTPNLNYEYIRTELDKLQLREFYDNIISALKVWFEDQPQDEKSDFITQIIFTSGEYGRKASSVASKALKKKKGGKTASDIAKKRFFASVFTGYDIMCREYHFLKKLPFLLPFMWIVHFPKRLFKKNKLKRFFAEINHLTDKKVSDYEKSLQYVGLDFNFSE